MALAPLGVGTKAATLPLVRKLLAFFLKAAGLTFGSGLVIVPFLKKGLVQQTGGREFLVAVAIGSMSPGPVVITATFSLPDSGAPPRRPSASFSPRSC